MVFIGFSFFSRFCLLPTSDAANRQTLDRQTIDQAATLQQATDRRPPQARQPNQQNPARNPHADRNAATPQRRNANQLAATDLRTRNPFREPFSGFADSRNGTLCANLRKVSTLTHVPTCPRPHPTSHTSDTLPHTVLP